MDQNNHINNELDDLAPNLSKFKKDMPYTVPDAYFDTFPMKIRERIAHMEAVPESRWYALWLPKYSYVAASICFLIITIGFLFLKNSGSHNITGTLVVKSAPNADYVIEHIDEELLIETSPSLPAKTPSKNKINLNSSKKTYAEEYLVETIDESTLTEEL